MKISRKGVPRHVKFTVTVLPPSNKGRNKRGTCLHKCTKRVSPPKAQLQTGYAPKPVTAYAFRADRT